MRAIIGTTGGIDTSRKKCSGWRIRNQPQTYRERWQAYPGTVRTPTRSYVIYELDPIHRARRFGNGDAISADYDRCIVIASEGRGLREKISR